MPTETGEVQLRRGISSLWASSNPVLLDGEPGYDKTNKILKIGDGSRQWSALDLTTLMKLDNPGVPGQTLQKTADGAAWQTLLLSSFVNVIIDTPEAHGAKRDGKLITDLTITAGTLNTANSASGKFAGAAPGMVIMIPFAGTRGAHLIHITTVATVVSNTQVTLTAPAAHAVTNQLAVYGTDDTAAFKAAFNNVVALGQAANQYYGEVWCSAGIYIIAGAPDNSQHGYAQIPIPYQQPDGMKFTLTLKGTSDNTGLSHWLQPEPQMTGAVIVSAAMPAASPTFGAASVIGGPTSEQGYGNGNNGVFNNMLFRVDGVTVTLPFDHPHHGIDLFGLAEANVPNMGTFAFGNVVGNYWWPNFAPTNFLYNSGWVPCGLVMPNQGNNDNCNIGLFSSEGLTGGVALGEHAHADSIRCISQWVGVTFTVIPNGGSPISQNDHSMDIQYLSTEVCRTHIFSLQQGVYAAILNIDNWDPEDLGGTAASVFHINDLYGEMCGEIKVNTQMVTQAFLNNSACHVINTRETVGAKTVLRDQITTTLSTGAPITSIPVANSSGGGLGAAIPAGTFTLTSGGNTQTFTTTGAAVNATSVPVNSITPNFAYSFVQIGIPVPNSGVGYKNPFMRDAFVAISGGTVTSITIDGQVQGTLTSGVFMVPSGKSISWAGSAPPTMRWTVV